MQDLVSPDNLSCPVLIEKKMKPDRYNNQYVTLNEGLKIRKDFSVK